MNPAKELIELLEREIADLAQYTPNSLAIPRIKKCIKELKKE